MTQRRVLRMGVQPAELRVVTEPSRWTFLAPIASSLSLSGPSPTTTSRSFCRCRECLDDVLHILVFEQSRHAEKVAALRCVYGHLLCFWIERARGVDDFGLDSVDLPIRRAVSVEFARYRSAVDATRRSQVLSELLTGPKSRRPIPAPRPKYSSGWYSHRAGAWQ